MVLLARRSPRARLYSAVPRSSQWPSIRTSCSGCSRSQFALVSSVCARAPLGRAAPAVRARRVRGVAAGPVWRRAARQQGERAVPPRGGGGGVAPPAPPPAARPPPPHHHPPPQRGPPYSLAVFFD